MKTNFFSTSISLSILPVFFLISGSLLFIQHSLPLYLLNADYLFTLFLVLILGSYFFLRDAISVFINISCAINTMLGILFCIDLLKIESSSLTATVIIMSLGFSVFLNTILLFSIHKNKKASDTDAKNAVKKTLEMNLGTIILSCIGFSLINFLLSFKYDSNIASEFVLIMIIGFTVAIISGIMLLFLLSNLLLAHLNQERMQDDLELSYSAEFLLFINQKIEKTAAVMVWISSPIVNNKIIALTVTSLTTLFVTYFITDFFEFIFFIKNANTFIFGVFVICFLIVAVCYQSYILAFIPVFSMFLNYFFLEFICRIFLSNSSLIMEICFYANISTTLIGTYFLIDTTLNYYRNNSTIEDAILNAAAKTLYFIFNSAFIMTLYIVFAMYLIKGFDINILKAGGIIICSSIILFLPLSAYLRVFLSLHDYIIRPRKKVIKSIYL